MLKRHFPFSSDFFRGFPFLRKQNLFLIVSKEIFAIFFNEISFMELILCYENENLI